MDADRPLLHGATIVLNSRVRASHYGIGRPVGRLNGQQREHLILQIHFAVPPLSRFPARD